MTCGQRPWPRRLDMAVRGRGAEGLPRASPPFAPRVSTPVRLISRALSSDWQPRPLLQCLGVCCSQLCSSGRVCTQILRPGVPLPACSVPHDPAQPSAGLAWPGLRASPRDSSETCADRGLHTPAQTGQGAGHGARCTVTQGHTLQSRLPECARECVREPAPSNGGQTASGNVLEPRDAHCRRHKWFILVEKLTRGLRAPPPTPSTLTNGRGSQVNLSSPTWAGAGTAPGGRWDTAGWGAGHPTRPGAHTARAASPGRAVGITRVFRVSPLPRRAEQEKPGTGDPWCDRLGAASSSGVSSEGHQPSYLSSCSLAKSTYHYIFN